MGYNEWHTTKLNSLTNFSVDPNNTKFHQNLLSIRYEVLGQ